MEFLLVFIKYCGIWTLLFLGVAIVCGILWAIVTFIYFVFPYEVAGAIATVIFFIMFFASISAASSTTQDKKANKL